LENRRGYSTPSTAETHRVHHGHRVTVDGFGLLHLEGFAFFVFVFGEETPTVRDVPFGPGDFVELREVLREVGVGVKCRFYLAEIDDPGSDETIPFSFYHGMGDELGSKRLRSDWMSVGTCRRVPSKAARGSAHSEGSIVRVSIRLGLASRVIQASLRILA
jgi:hypothetical protein